MTTTEITTEPRHTTSSRGLTLTEADGFDPHWLDVNRSRGRTHDTENVPPAFRHAEPHAPEITSWVRAVLDGAITASARHPNPHTGSGPLLLILGQVGRGKTHQAYGALRALSASGARCVWVAVTAPDMYGSLRPRHGVDSETILERYMHAPALLIDDFAATKGTDWTEEINYRLIDYRTRFELPTLITSNSTLAELSTVLGDAIVSRLCTGTHVAITGPDRRRAART